MSQFLCSMRLKKSLDQSINSTLKGAKTVADCNMSKSSDQAKTGISSSSESKGRPTVIAAQNFNAAKDADCLRKAMKGWGTNEVSLVNVLCRRSNEQRMEILRSYLIDEIRSETSGNFGKILIGLLMPKTEFYARELKDAIAGMGTDDDALIEIMCTLSNREIRDVSLLYEQMFSKTLEQDIKDDTSGDYKRLLTLLLKANRDESTTIDIKAVVADAKALKKAGIDRWGTDEKTFIEIMCLRSYAQIKLISEEYMKMTAHTLEKDIISEFSGDIKHALLAILSFALYPVGYFADRLHKSMAGFGTNDKSLVRIAVTRCEIDMMDIKDEFQKKHGQTLASFITDDTSGDYKDALYALTGEFTS